MDCDANGDSQLNKKFSIANNGFFNNFGGTCAAGVEIADDERDDWNLPSFDFNTILRVRVRVSLATKTRFDPAKDLISWH